MFEFNVSILTCVMLLIAVVVVLFRSQWLKPKEVDRMKQILQGAAKKLMVASHVCVHQFGYLNSLPKDKPIPDECMGCSDIIECLATKGKKKTIQKMKTKRKTAKQTRTRKQLATVNVTRS